MAEFSRLRLRLAAWAGVLCVAGSLLLNEWVLQRVLSDDSHFEPLTVARIQLLQVLLAVAGAIILATRRRLARRNPLRAMLRERPRASALLVGIAFSVVLWLCVEAAFGFLNSSPRTTVVRVTAADGSSGETVAVADERLGYKLIPSLAARMRLTDDKGRVAYDIDSVTDEYSRRVTPVAPHGRAEHALFFGCSFT